MLAALDVRMIRHSGIGTHIRGLLHGFRELGAVNEILLLGDRAQLGREPVARDFSSVHFNAGIYSMGEVLQVPWDEIETAGALVFHSPHYNIPNRPKRAGDRIKRVVTIHDVIHLTHSEGLSPFKKIYARYMLKRAWHGADAVCTVSQHSERELVRLFGPRSDEATITSNAPAAIFFSQPSKEERAKAREVVGLGPDTPFFLGVGIDKPHKNFRRLALEFRHMWRDGNMDHALVLVGGDFEAMRPAPKLYRPGKVAWESLPALYAEATALVQPSLAEGFGLPIVEAQAIGTPVISSNASCLPEVAGENGAEFFDPKSGRQMQAALLKVAEDPALRQQLVEAGRENVKRYSWKTSAQKLLDFYCEVAA